MAGAVINCKKCNKIFQKRISDLCPACILVEEEQFKVLYRALQKSASQGGIAIEELSNEVEIPVEDIERFYLEGRLSTAGSLLKFQCQTCGVMMAAHERKGRFCHKCSEYTASKAGVEVKSTNQLEKASMEERQRQERLALLKKNQPQKPTERRFGVGRNR